jgi:hypothetical protein
MLFAELIDGPAASGYMLNSGDAGLLKSLARLSATDAARSSNGGAPAVAHADHLRYGLSLLNRWAGGDDPFPTADWSASWNVRQISERDWETLRADLGIQARAWQTALALVDGARDAAVAIAIASVAHTAYHLGAIRQIAPATRGPAQ